MMLLFAVAYLAMDIVQIALFKEKMFERQERGKTARKVTLGIAGFVLLASFVCVIALPIVPDVNFKKNLDVDIAPNSFGEYGCYVKNNSDYDALCVEMEIYFESSNSEKIKVKLKFDSLEKGRSDSFRSLRYDGNYVASSNYTFVDYKIKNIKFDEDYTLVSVCLIPILLVGAYFVLKESLA